MKIMLITQLPPPTGGIATWSIKYIHFCNKHDIALSTVNNAMIGKRGADFHAKKNLFTEIRRSCTVFKNIIRQKNIFSPDIVHLNSACSPIGIIRDYISLLIIGKIPTVLHCRCNIEDQLKNNKIGKFFFKLTAEKAKKIIVLNDMSKKHIKEKLNLTAEIVPNFINEDYIIKTEKEINNIIEKVCYTGHIHTEKGIDEIIELSENFPNIQFILVGKIDDKYSGISKQNIIFTGNVSIDDVKRKLDEADVFVFPSYTEGFSNSLAEAMARGLPVIASDVGANSDMIENKGGIVVSSKQVIPLIEAIDNMKDAKLRKQMSVWNRAKVENEYITSKVMQKLMNIYREII